MALRLANSDDQAVAGPNQFFLPKYFLMVQYAIYGAGETTIKIQKYHCRRYCGRNGNMGDPNKSVDILIADFFRDMAAEIRKW
jgi:hypothetical protein